MGLLVLRDVLISPAKFMRFPVFTRDLKFCLGSGIFQLNIFLDIIV